MQSVSIGPANIVDDVTNIDCVFIALSVVAKTAEKFGFLAFGLDAIQKDLHLVIHHQQQFLSIQLAVEVGGQGRLWWRVFQFPCLAGQVLVGIGQAQDRGEAQVDTHLATGPTGKPFPIVWINEGLHRDTARQGQPDEDVPDRNRFHSPQPQVFQAILILVIEEGAQYIAPRAEYLLRLREIHALGQAVKQGNLAGFPQQQVLDAVIVDVFENLFVGEGEYASKITEIQVVYIELTQLFLYGQNVQRIAGRIGEVIIATGVGQEDSQHFLGARYQVVGSIPIEVTQFEHGNAHRLT